MNVVKLYLAATAFCVMPILAEGQNHDFSRYGGLSGRELADAVRADYAPTSYGETGTIETWPGAGTRAAFLIPAEWTGENLNDRYNIVGGDDDFIRLREDYIPGNLTETTHSAQGWAIGFTTISGIPTNAWQPAADRRGDAARRIMYISLMYPRELWHSRGVMFMADGNWPLLTTYGKNLLKEWNESDPVDRREIEESARIFSTQGNENPFVIYPELFEYLWGDKSGETVIPDDKIDLSTLKASYSRSGDKFIDFYSPLVPEDAIWFFDGGPVDSESIALDDVATGTHIISYRAAKGSGKLKIAVTP